MIQIDENSSLKKENSWGGKREQRKGMEDLPRQDSFSLECSSGA